MKRIVLFLATNLAVLLVLGVVANLFGLNRFLVGSGLDVGALLGFAAVMGFGGAFISLLISKPMAKWTTGAQTIDVQTHPEYAWIVRSVEQFAAKAGLKTPEVVIFPGAPNAFATGAFKNSALVAVSTGLLETMNREQVEAVIGHEVAHIANGDMVTMTLLQGVMNTFVVFIARIVGYLVDRVVLRNNSDHPGIGYYAATFVMDLLLGVLAAIIVAWFSRRREFRADAGSAALMGRRRPMIEALQRLGSLDPGEMPKAVKTLAISSRVQGITRLFATHPPIEERVAALQQDR